MRIRGLWRYSRYLLFAGLLAIASAPAAVALTSSSTHYQVTETEFGASSSKETCSAAYCARTTLGSLTTGDAAGSTVKATFGPITPDEPSLQVIVEPGESNLGVLTTEHTATKETVVKISSYLSNGYVLQVTGDPPKITNHTLSAITGNDVASAMGTEQFGINLAANTSPSVGVAPVQVPDANFSYGQVEPGYGIPNRFKYISGDTVARSTVATGRTDYTISVIVNISNNTPAGHFSGDLSAVVVPFY